jgi:hypothetical protein
MGIVVGVYKFFTHIHMCETLPTSIPDGTLPIGYPAGGSNTAEVVRYFTLIDSILDKKQLPTQ